MQNLFQDILKGQDAVRRATVHFEWEDDPKRPGRRAYRITGETKEAVQSGIDARMRWVETLEGAAFANFTNPGRLPNGKWASLGEIIIEQGKTHA